MAASAFSWNCATIVGITPIYFSTVGQFPVFQVSFSDGFPLIVHDEKPERRKPIKAMHQRITGCRGKPLRIETDIAMRNTYWLVGKLNSAFALQGGHYALVDAIKINAAPAAAP